MIGSVAKSNTSTSRTVITCYDLLDLAIGAGVRDFTEGMYKGAPTTPYEEAQQNQAEHLLDLASCQRGSRLLDIGCGYGRILETARRRGAFALGITISPAQVDDCRTKDLDVRLLDYRQIPAAWHGQFDCVIANGSLEHFVQPQDAVEGRADDVYHKMFTVAHGVLDPCSASGRFVTTAIHFARVHVDPSDMIRPPRHFRRGSTDHHYALLAHGFGGFYPSVGQLARCASGRFTLVAEEDGTEDYHLTAEQWLDALKRAAYGNPRFLRLIAGKLLKHPRQALTLLDCLLIAQSWNWQFRGTDPPMKLLRQTWQLPSVAHAKVMRDDPQTVRADDASFVKRASLPTHP